MTLDRVNTSLEDALNTRGHPLAIIRNLSTTVRTQSVQTNRARRLLLEEMQKARADYTLQQIGDAAGISKQRVQQLLKED